MELITGMDVYFVRAFSSERFSGNPAAVCIVDEFPQEKQHIATAINFSETVFVKPYKKNIFLIRWFSPKDEAPLCGHATMAAAYMINKKYGFSMMTLIHRQGVICVHVDARDYVHMMMPIRELEALTVTPLHKTCVPGEIIAAYTDHVIDVFVLPTEHDVLRYQPDFEKISQLNKRALTITARAKEFDYVARYFAPRVGIDEDPFCGSVNCRLVPYWAKVLGKNTLSSYQLKGCSEFILGADSIEFIAEAELYEERKLMATA